MASISLAGIVRLARVTITSFKPAVSSPISAWARTASITASAGTAPVVPRSGARKIGDVGDDAGIFDQVADAHDIAGDGGLGFEHRPVLVGRGGGSARM